MSALVPIALQIVGSLATSGFGGGIVNFITSLLGLGGTKADGVAEKVVAAAESIFGTRDPKQIELLIQQDKSKADLALKRMENDLEEYRIQIEDIRSARGRDIEVRKMSGGTNARANVMLVGAFICLIFIIFGVLYFRASIPDGIAAILNTACGSLLTLLGQAFNFEFGSSRSSSEKTDQMANAMTNLTKAVGK